MEDRVELETVLCSFCVLELEFLLKIRVWDHSLHTCNLFGDIIQGKGVKVREKGSKDRGRAKTRGDYQVRPYFAGTLQGYTELSTQGLENGSYPPQVPWIVNDCACSGCTCANVTKVLNSIFAYLPEKSQAERKKRNSWSTIWLSYMDRKLVSAAIAGIKCSPVGSEAWHKR